MEFEDHITLNQYSLCCLSLLSELSDLLSALLQSQPALNSLDKQPHIASENKMTGWILILGQAICNSNIYEAAAHSD